MTSPASRTQGDAPPDAVAVFSTGALSQPCLEPAFDVGRARIGIGAPQVLAHEVDANLEQLECCLERAIRRRHDAILSGRRPLRHLDMLRRATPERRLALALSLSRSVVSLARDALARQSPESSDEEIGLRFVAHSYGQDVAIEVRTTLAARRAS